MPSGELSFIGISRFRGYWNASTNVALSGGVSFTGSHVSGGYGNGVLAGTSAASVGEYWQVNTAGSTNLDGQNAWQVNDWCVYTTGSSWTKVDYNETISTIVVGSTDTTLITADMLVSSSNTQILINSGSIISGSNNLTYDYTAGIVRLTGSLFVSGTLVANEFKVNVVNESVVNISSTGSTSFGNSSDDTHSFVGSGYFSNGSANIFDLDTANTALIIRDDTDTGDFFRIVVAANGATQIQTFDDDADNADLILNVDGDIELDADTGRVTITDNGASAFDFEATSGSFKVWTYPTPGSTGGIADNHSAFATLKVAGSGSTTLATFDSEGTSGHLTLDADGDIILDAAGDNIEIKKAGTHALSINLVTTGSGPSVDFQTISTSDYAAVRFVNATGTVNAMSFNNGGYGGWGHKKPIYELSGSDLNLSTLSLTGAMGYCGSIIKAIQTQESSPSGNTTITLPSATTEDGARQLMGYQFRVMLDTAGNRGIKIVRGDASNDFMFGYIVDASSNSAPGGVIFSGTGPGGGGHDFASFVGAMAAPGDYVDVVCVAATDSLMKWLVTGVAST